MESKRFDQVYKYKSPSDVTIDKHKFCDSGALELVFVIVGPQAKNRISVTAIQ